MCGGPAGLPVYVLTVNSLPTGNPVLSMIFGHEFPGYRSGSTRRQCFRRAGRQRKGCSRPRVDREFRAGRIAIGVEELPLHAVRVVTPDGDEPTIGERGKLNAALRSSGVVADEEVVRREPEVTACNRIKHVSCPILPIRGTAAPALPLNCVHHFGSPCSHPETPALSCIIQDNRRHLAGPAVTARSRRC